MREQIIYIFFVILSDIHASEDGEKPIEMESTVFQSGDTKSDPPIVIMHGLFGSRMNWNCMSRLLHEKLERRVYSLDARNHGDSPHTKEHNYPLLAKDVEHYLEDHEIEKPVLLGHSMGGRAMMYFALLHPELVHSLIVVDISPIGTNLVLEEMYKVFDALENIDFHDYSRETSIFKVRKNVEDRLMRKLKDQRVANFLSTNVIEDKSGKYHWKLNLGDLYKNYDPHIMKFPLPENAKYDGPTLFIVGAQSDFINPKDYDAIKDIFPKAEFVKIDAGHWLHAEKPQECLKAICKFLRVKK